MLRHDLVIIPAWNEEANLPVLVRELMLLEPKVDVLVVNDGSTDKTSLVCRRLTQSFPRFRYLEHATNLGIGRAVQSGLLYACREGYERAVQCDGDGQHSPRDVSTLLELASQGEDDVIIGSRFCSDSGVGFRSSATRRLGIRYFSFLIFFLTGRRIFDTTSGFRVFNRKAIEHLSNHYPEDYPEPESIIFLLKNKMRIREVPVVMRERQTGTSSINLRRAIYYMVKVSLAVSMQWIRRPIAGKA